MADESGQARQAVPIRSLNVDQLGLMQRQLNQEISFLTDSLKELKVVEMKFAGGEEAVQAASKIDEGREVLIPLTESMYIPAKVLDPDKHLIDIGTGYFVEMTSTKAIDYFQRKQQYLKKQIHLLQSVLPEKMRARNIITEHLQKRIEELCSQMQNSSSETVKK